MCGSSCVVIIQMSSFSRGLGVKGGGGRCLALPVLFFPPDSSHCLEGDKSRVTSLMFEKYTAGSHYALQWEPGKGDHMLGLRATLACRRSPPWITRITRSALSELCCKTIKPLLTYILLIALSTWKHKDMEVPPGFQTARRAWRRSHR